MKITELLNESLKYEPLQIKKAINQLNTHCKNALWMLHENKPLYRGSRNENLVNLLNNNGFVYVDPSKAQRQSANTSNYYTLIFDNIPSMAKFPKRSKSFICSTSKYIADGYSDYGPAAILIPFDNTLIGAVNRQDMWDTVIKLAGQSDKVEDWNRSYEGLNLPQTSYNDFISALSKIPQLSNVVNPGAYGTDYRLAMIAAKKPNFTGLHLAKEIPIAYSPEKTKFTLHTTSNLQGVRGECWVGGPCILINYDMWNQLRFAYAKLMKA